MKILEITHSFVRYENDYISRFLLTLFEGLNSLGAEIKVLAPHAKGLKERESMNGIFVERFRYAGESREILAYRGNMHEIAFSSPFNIIVLKDFINSALRCVKENIKDVDIVHLHWWIPFGIPLSFLTKSYKKPFVISLHGTDVRLIGKIKLLRTALKWLAKRTDRFVVVSSFIKKTLVNYGIDEKKIEIIPMPVEEELFYPKKNRSRKSVVLTVARFSKQKRVDRILMVADKFRNDKIEFHIVGSGEIENEIYEMINRMNLHNVKIIPPMPREKIAKKMRNVDVFLLLSENEGFGMVAIESMLSGVPVILSRSGGFIDIVKDGETGMLVDGNDTEEITNAVHKLLKNSKKRDRIIRNARKFAMSYSRKNIAKRFEALFNNILKI